MTMTATGITWTNYEHAGTNQVFAFSSELDADRALKAIGWVMERFGVEVVDAVAVEMEKNYRGVREWTIYFTLLKDGKEV